MFNKPKAVAGVALFAALAMGATACGDGGANQGMGGSFDDCEIEPATCNSGERRQGGDVVWALDAGWGGWNEWATADRSVGLAQVLAGKQPKIGEWHPDGEWRINDGILTEEPELIEEDPMKVQYQLNPDANWGDGTPIGLDDFLWHWYQGSGNEELCSPADCESSAITWGANVSDIEQTGDNTFVITYNDGYIDPEWKYHMVLSYPAHIAEANGFEDWASDPDVMGESFWYFSDTIPLDWTAGPYRVQSAEAGSYIIYEPNPDWAGSIKPTLDTITIEVFNDQDSIITEMRQETVQGFAPGNLDPESVGQIDFIEGVDHFLSVGPNWTHIDFNMQSDLLQDPALRKAVFTAIDVEDLIDRTFGLTVEGLERKTNHTFKNDSEFHIDAFADSPQGTGDEMAAREILEEAGYTWDRQGNTLFTPEGDEVELEFRVVAGDRLRTTMAELTQHYLSVIGIHINVNTFEGTEFATVLNESQFDMITYSWSTDPRFTAQPHNHWHSTSASNYGNLNSELVDELTSNIRSTTDLAEAADRANEAVLAVTDEAYVLPIIDAPVLIAADSDLVNIRDNWATSIRALYNMAEWGYAEGTE
ncbi:ABC transporter substrate-binding protein [Natronoglycomyces albus]|uniref:Solute-binding protein family 5 domain-containing protein n=1 Tax=Natronoglycomyces albus TaxID=2811108 RepID=A0A895XFS3_9ACTN|nr:ABC transporter substrate-binding protein [Natronoglycomyces albus]QSB04701.1 hypothetical protein JQS30_13115 [Natronoglycomyces albus]